MPVNLIWGAVNDYLPSGSAGPVSPPLRHISQVGGPMEPAKAVIHSEKGNAAKRPHQVELASWQSAISCPGEASLSGDDKLGI